MMPASMSASINQADVPEFPWPMSVEDKARSGGRRIRVIQQGSGVTDEQIPSPALAASDQAREAYELKCLIDSTAAVRLEELAGTRLELDPFCRNTELGQYQISTLATDTPAFAVFHRESGFAARKYRIRRYGNETWCFLERKTRKGNRVTKFRTQVALSDLAFLQEESAPAQWSGEWFHQSVTGRYQPVCLMSYQRRAFVGHSDEGPVRLTFDRQLVATLISGWQFESSDKSIPVIGEQVICEFKFTQTMPVLFKTMIQEMSLNPGGFSKYRHCLSMLTGMPAAAPSASREVCDA